MVDGTNAVAVERGGLQLEALPWSERPMLLRETKASVKC